MKVAVLTHYWPSSAEKWAGRSAFETLRILAQRHDVRVFYPEPRYPRLLTPPGRRGTHLDRTWQPGEVVTEYIPYPTLPWVGRPMNGWTMAQRLRGRIREWAPDVLLSYVVYPHGYATTRVAGEIGVPSVLTAIGSDLNRIPGRLVERHVRRALREATVTTTVSRDLARTAVRLGAPPERTQAILNGCDTTFFRPGDRGAARASVGIPLDPEAIVYLGRLDVRKGLRELVEAAARLRAVRPQAHIYMVGDGPDRGVLDELVAANQVAETVHFRKPVNFAGVAQWIAAADLVTLPSYMEGCPNVVIEALASGRPVVATEVGGIPELMDRDSGQLVPARDSAALAEALEATLARTWDPADLGRHHARSWHDVAAELEAVLGRARQLYAASAPGRSHVAE